MQDHQRWSHSHLFHKNPILLFMKCNIIQNFPSITSLRSEQRMSDLAELCKIAKIFFLCSYFLPHYISNFHRVSYLFSHSFHIIISIIKDNNFKVQVIITFCRIFHSFFFLPCFSCLLISSVFSVRCLPISSLCY